VIDQLLLGQLEALALAAAALADGAVGGVDAVIADLAADVRGFAGGVVLLVDLPLLVFAHYA
jgi:hypothetical protein